MHHLPVKKGKISAITITIVVAGLLTIWGIYGIGEYGIALFILTPLFIGVCSTVLYSRHQQITKKESRQIGFISLAIFTAFLFICAIEGFICILMAAPLGLFLTWLGSSIGYQIMYKAPHVKNTSLLVLVGMIPLIGFIEKDNMPDITSVVTSLEINSDAATVWKNVLVFPELEKPQELIFKIGIAYPIDAKIKGRGVGST